MPPPEGKKVKIQVYLTQKEWALLEEICRDLGEDNSAVMRHAFIRYLAELGLLGRPK